MVQDDDRDDEQGTVGRAKPDQDGHGVPGPLGCREPDVRL